jgi:hypothetical protein
MTRPPRRSSSRGAAGGFWIRAWGQREPALQGTGRLNCVAQGLGWLKGGLDIPATHADCRSPQREHPLRTLTRSAWSRAGRVERSQPASHRWLLCLDALPLVPQPIQRPWPQSRSLRGWSAVFPKPQFRGRHERPGFPTANDQISNDLKAALVDELMAQLHGCATPSVKVTPFSITPGRFGTSGPSEEDQGR